MRRRGARADRLRAPAPTRCAAAARAGGRRAGGLSDRDRLRPGRPRRRRRAVARIFAAKGRPADHPLIVHVAEPAAARRVRRRAGRPLAQRLVARVLARPADADRAAPRRPRRAAAAGGQDSIGLRCRRTRWRRRCCAGRAARGVAGRGRAQRQPLRPRQPDHRGACAAGVRRRAAGARRRRLRRRHRIGHRRLHARGAPALLRPGQLGARADRGRAGRAAGRARRRRRRAPRARWRRTTRPRRRCSLFDAALSAPGIQAGACAPRAGRGRSGYIPASPPRPGAGRWPPAMPADAAAAAHELFAVLREFDAAGVSAIWVERPPPDPAWDGVRDRLQRAPPADGLRRPVAGATRGPARCRDLPAPSSTRLRSKDDPAHGHPALAPALAGLLAVGRALAACGGGTSQNDPFVPTVCWCSATRTARYETPTAASTASTALDTTAPSTAGATRSGCSRWPATTASRLPNATPPRSRDPRPGCWPMPAPRSPTSRRRSRPRSPPAASATRTSAPCWPAATTCSSSTPSPRHAPRPPAWPKRGARGRRLAAVVNRLVELGVKVVVSDVPDMGLTPYATAQNASRGTDRAALLTRLTTAFNEQLGVNLLLDGRFIGLVQAQLRFQAHRALAGQLRAHDITHAACTVALPNCTTATLMPRSAVASASTCGPTTPADRAGGQTASSARAGRSTAPAATRSRTQAAPPAILGAATSGRAAIDELGRRGCTLADSASVTALASTMGQAPSDEAVGQPERDAQREHAVHAQRDAADVAGAEGQQACGTKLQVVSAAASSPASRRRRVIWLASGHRWRRAAPTAPARRAPAAPRWRCGWLTIATST